MKMVKFIKGKKSYNFNRYDYSYYIIKQFSMISGDYKVELIRFYIDEKFREVMNNTIAPYWCIS